MSAGTPPRAGSRRLVAPDDVGPQGLTLEIEFDAAERESLKRRLDLLELDLLAAELRLGPAGETEGAIRVSGTIRAELAQSCVVTLEPVPRTLCESISVLYTQAPEDAADDEVEVLAEGEEAEPLPTDGIDAGAVVAEHLALFLDPYPRHPDAPDGPLTYSAGEGQEEDGRFGRRRRRRAVRSAWPTQKQVVMCESFV